MTSSVFQKRFYIYLKKTPNLRKKNFEKNVWLGNENCYSCRWVWTVKISIFKTSRKLKNMYWPQIRLLCAKRKWERVKFVTPRKEMLLSFSCVWFLTNYDVTKRKYYIHLTILCVLKQIFERRSSNMRLPFVYFIGKTMKCDDRRFCCSPSLLDDSLGRQLLMVIFLPDTWPSMWNNFKIKFC